MKDLVPYLWLQKRAEMYSSVSQSDFSDLKKVLGCYKEGEKFDDEEDDRLAKNDAYQSEVSEN